MHRNNKNYSIELCLAIFVIALLTSSCGTIWQFDAVASCPAYATVECENKNIN